jgi:hypothetical protein
VRLDVCARWKAALAVSLKPGVPSFLAICKKKGTAKIPFRTLNSHSRSNTIKSGFSRPGI